MLHHRKGSTVEQLISDFSEEYYAAGWLVDCEYELWARVRQYQQFGCCTGWGFGSSETTTCDIVELVEAVKQYDSWAYWDKKTNEVVTVSLYDWVMNIWEDNASDDCKELAGTFPECGVFGSSVHIEGTIFPVFLSCELPAGHEGEHRFTDKYSKTNAPDTSNNSEKNTLLEQLGIPETDNATTFNVLHNDNVFTGNVVEPEPWFGLTPEQAYHKGRSDEATLRQQN